MSLFLDAQGHLDHLKQRSRLSEEQCESERKPCLNEYIKHTQKQQEQNMHKKFCKKRKKHISLCQFLWPTLSQKDNV